MLAENSTFESLFPDVNFSEQEIQESAQQLVNIIF